MIEEEEMEKQIDDDDGTFDECAYGELILIWVKIRSNLSKRFFWFLRE